MNDPSDPSEVRETYECDTVQEKNPDFEVYYRGEGCVDL